MPAHPLAGALTTPQALADVATAIAPVVLLAVSGDQFNGCDNKHYRNRTLLADPPTFTIRC